MMERRNVLTQQNPADIGSQGYEGDRNQKLWTKEPSYLDQRKTSSENIETKTSWAQDVN